jgi:hypothetical protein
MQRARGKAVKVSINTMILTLQPVKVIAREREVMEATHDIALYIQNKVSNLPNDEFKRWPMSKVFQLFQYLTCIQILLISKPSNQLRCKMKLLLVGEKFGRG